MRAKHPQIDPRLLAIDHLTTEAQNPASLELDRLTPLEIAYLMNEEDGRVASAVLEAVPEVAIAIERIASAFRSGGRLIYVGAGTSGRLGVLDAAECPPTFGTPPEMVVGVIAGGYGALVRAVEGAEDRPEDAARDLDALQLSSRDVVCGIATSGRTPYVVAALQHARSRGCFTIGIACNQDAALRDECDLPIVAVVGPEVLSGSTRLKAGTATKLILNMLTTGAMVRIGKTYGNLMVDLKATNLKLRLRSIRIVSQLLDIDRDRAEQLLESCDWEVKTALVAGKRGCSPQEARHLLQQAGGHVRLALGEGSQHHRRLPAGSRLVAGIDGGGSKTRAILGAVLPDGTVQVLATASCEGCNPNLYGPAAAARTIVRAVCEAARQVGAELPLELLYCCVAGAGAERQRTSLARILARTRLARATTIATDADAVFASARLNTGLCIIAGTGSFAEARYSDGSRAVAGGWGWAVGDSGSAADLGRMALKRTCRRLETGAPLTELDRRLLQTLEVEETEARAGLRQALYAGGRDATVRTLASVARAITEAAEEGDDEARSLLAAAAEQLADLVQPLAARFGNDQWHLIVSGGLFQHSSALRQLFVQALNDRHLRNFVLVNVDDPTRGAFDLAVEQLRRNLSLKKDAEHDT